MQWQQTPYAPLLITISVITFSLAFYAYQRRHIPGASDLTKLLLAVTVWILFYNLNLNAVLVQDKLTWLKAQCIGIALSPVAYMLFTLKFTGLFYRLKQPRLFTAGLLTIPAITLLFIWIKPLNHLVWPVIMLVNSNGLNYLELEYSAWFWIFIAYSLLLIVLSTLILLRQRLTSQHRYRGQITLIIIGSLFPLFGTVFYLTGNSPIPNLNPTPFSFAIASTFFAWSLFRYNFLDIVPVARSLVIEKLEEGVIVVDTQNRVVDINETAVSLLQNEPGATLGKVLTLNHPQWVPLQNILEAEHPTKSELVIGKTYYELSVTFLAHANGEANGRLITLHNITHRKEAELLLQHAKEAAEAADQAKTNFLTNMSHEIRTPLNAVMGMAEMLRQTNLNHHQQEMIEVVTESSNQLMLLINNILDFAKLETGDLKLTEQTFDLVDCIEASLESVRQAANAKQLRLGYEIEDQTPTWLIGDPVRLRQIFTNLLENSIKFTEEGHVDIGISFTQEEGRLMLHFVVSDSGVGIAPEQVQQLFLPFRQIDSSMTRSHGGNGLGLVLCKRLVGLMKGDIYLESTIGQGTAVHFSAQFSPATTDDPPTVSLRQHKATLLNKRLLVITTNAIQRRQISREARIAGLEVYAAGSRHEAGYWIANSEPFDVVLLDTAVWREDPAIIGQLQVSKRHGRLPILLLNPTANPMPLETSEVFSGYVTLPIVGSQLYDTLMNVLSVSVAAAPSPEPGETMGERHPLKILLVEDNRLNQRILKDMLAKLGYQADCAANGKIGVDAAAKRLYDVILMDIQMPVMDGIEATTQILADSSTDKRPFIIAVTAHAMEGDREHYLSLGMNEYISKPVTVKKLIEALYQSINSNGSQTDAPELAVTPPPSAAEDPPIQAIDLEVLKHLVGSNIDQFLAMMAPIFLEDTSEILARLAGAIENDDYTGVRHAAHTLKGSSASMAMTQLSGYSRELEQSSIAQDLSNAPQLLQQIQAEYGRVEAALASLVKAAV